MTYIAEDIICQAPTGRLEGTAAFREFMGPFAQILTRSSLIAAFGDDERAVVMYDTDTVPVKDAPGAECVTVRGGKITHRSGPRTGSGAHAARHRSQDRIRKSNPRLPGPGSGAVCYPARVIRDQPTTTCSPEPDCWGSGSRIMRDEMSSPPRPARMGMSSAI